MFRRVYETNNTKMSLYITIKCKGKKAFRVFAEDYQKANSKYADRMIEVNNERTIFFSFPVIPKKLLLAVVNVKDGADKDFTVEVTEGLLKTYNIWLDNDSRDFLELAIPFCQVCGFEQASPKGRIYQTEDKAFTIRYFPVITDPMKGVAMSTPARIGHQTGIIDISKVKYDTYTIPMRLMIALHEFSHKYKNPKINLEISNEIGADINALYIYLGLGFSKIDAICVYANVFLKAQTRGNIERMRKIMDYINKFENQEFAKLN
jgi:hypothetical protein